MKIIFALEGFFPSHKAGTEIYVLNLSKYLIIKGWNVHVIIPTTDSLNGYNFEGITVHTFPIKIKPDVKELNGLKKPETVNEFIEIVKTIKPIIVHFHSLGRAITGDHLEAVSMMGIKTVFTPHLGGIVCVKGDLLLYGKKSCNGFVCNNRCMICFLQSKGIPLLFSYIVSWFINLLNKIPFIVKKYPAILQVSYKKNRLKQIRKYADSVIVISNWIEKSLLLNRIKQVCFIPQGISNIFFPAGDFDPINDKALHLLFIGRMHPSKGFHVLRESITRFKNGEIFLHVITLPMKVESDYYMKNKKWARESKNVIWRESLEQKEIKDYFKKIDFLVLPSISNEMTPLVILEAFSQKIPVIGSSYIAINEMIREGIDGFIFKNGSIDNLTYVINNALIMKKNRKTLRENIIKPLSMYEVAEKIEKHYLKLIG